MTNFLVKKLKQKGYESTQLRTKIGIAAALLGLISNGLLFTGKIIIGLISGSVSIMADAINNLSDAFSSIMTLVGFRISAKPADKEHPYGHERFEYISGLLISILIIYVGLQFLNSSFQKILHPAFVTLTPTVFIVLTLSVLIKIWQSRMYQSFGREIKSDTLKATGQDSLNDVITTVAVLFSAIFEYFTRLRVDGYIGFVIALYILYSGIMMIRDFIDTLMGSRPTEEYIDVIEERLRSYPELLGFHDLLVHSYGPNKKFASVHVEMDDSWSLSEAHWVIDEIEDDFKEQLDVDMVCHIDPVPVNDPNYNLVYHQLHQIIMDLNLGIHLHDLKMNKKNPEKITFDLVIPQKCPVPDDQLKEQITQLIHEQIGDYQIKINFDHNYLLD